MPSGTFIKPSFAAAPGDNYTNKDGQKVYSVQIMVDELEFAESKNASAGSGDGRAIAMALAPWEYLISGSLVNLPTKITLFITELPPLKIPYSASRLMHKNLMTLSMIRTLCSISFGVVA